VLEYFRDLVLREIDAGRKHDRVDRAIGGARRPDLEYKLPAPGHVEQQSFGAPAAWADEFQRRRVVHAVPVLGHVRVDLYRLGHGLAGLGANLKFEREVLRDLDRLGLIGDDEARRLEPDAVFAR
jgi:hypothetical protein